MAIRDVFLARTAQEFADGSEAVDAALSSVFPVEEWGIEKAVVEYEPSNYKNLWDNEISPRVKTLLTENGKTRDDYEKWLGNLYYVLVNIYSKRLFRDGYKDNMGWRISCLSVPSAEIFLIGIASHYQGGQKHSALGEASVLLRQIAEDVLRASQPALNLPGRQIASSDWDATGLISVPVLKIADTDVTPVVGVKGLPIKAVRNTTLKKILASFITVSIIVPTATNEEFIDILKSYRDAAQVLGSHG